MCAGAVVELASVITVVMTAASVRAALAKEPGLTAAQWHTATGLLTFREVGGGLAVALWLFLAWAIGNRRDVARFTFIAFFTLISMTLISSLAQHAAVYAPADLIAGAAVWLTALVALVLIFTRQSNAFYRQGARPALAHPAG
jgi:predicted neutral ceramidase superfamily lipid hydrolase